MQKELKQKMVRLNIAAAVAFIAAAATLIPWPGVCAPSILGYNALCPFSPISTVILLYTANMIRGYVKRFRTAG